MDPASVLGPHHVVVVGVDYFYRGNEVYLAEMCQCGGAGEGKAPGVVGSDRLSLPLSTPKPNRSRDN